jgi:hypothetical protein
MAISRDAIALLREVGRALSDAVNGYISNVRHMLFMGPPSYETTSHEHIRRTGSMRVPLNLTMAQRLRSAITGRKP